jgi:archaellum component FlaG (FlaF/FlaG flagellin family)
LNNEYDEKAQYGIGMMIVFMACILVAAISSAVIIQAVEALAQQTQHTVHDANKEVATKMVILNVWVEDDYDDYLFMIEYQSMGKQVSPADVDWILSCTDNGNFYYKSGSLNSWASGPGSIWEVGQQPTSVTTLESGKRYFFGIDSGTNAQPNGAHCGPNWIEARGITATFMINMPDGGVTTQILKVTDLTIGASVT